MSVGAILNMGGLYLGSLGIIAKAYGHFSGLRWRRLIGTWSSWLKPYHGLYTGLAFILLGFIYFLVVV